MPDGPSSHSCSPLVAAAVHLLDQCAAFVEALPETVYAAPSETLPGGTVGKHLRHLLDHYAAIVTCPAGAEIEYDHRERNVPMETSRAEALGAVRRLKDQLRAAAGREGRTPVVIRVLLSADGVEAPLSSTLGRELAFATHHAVHHQAMMRAIAGEFGIEPPPGFGVAPSTLKHERDAAGVIR